MRERRDGFPDLLLRPVKDGVGRGLSCARDVKSVWVPWRRGQVPYAGRLSLGGHLYRTSVQKNLPSWTRYPPNPESRIPNPIGVFLVF